MTLGPLVTAVRDALDRHDGRGPLLVGISGAVGVGKSTAAAALSRDLRATGVSVETVCTDGFLRTNADLEAAGLAMRKGFPESFDHALLIGMLDRLRAGDDAVEVPEYSHVSYDRLPGPGRALSRAEVVIVEGVNALQSPVVEYLDISVYLHADEEVLRHWFTARFLDLCAEAEADPTTESFYRAFLDYDDDGRRDVAERTWTKVNGVNLRDHIEPTRARATYVVEKDSGHSIRIITAAT